MKIRDGRAAVIVRSGNTRNSVIICHCRKTGRLCQIERESEYLYDDLVFVLAKRTVSFGFCRLKMP